MAIVDLDEVKEQLNQSLDIDDDLIGRKIEAAQDHIERMLGFKVEERYGNGNNQEAVPPALKECVCQLAAHWYENREATLVGVNAHVLPLGVDDVITEFRDWSW